MYQLYSLQMTLEGLKYIAVMYSVNSGDIIKYELIKGEYSQKHNLFRKYGIFCS
jgi:hypothetical protein